LIFRLKQLLYDHSMNQWGQSGLKTGGRGSGFENWRVAGHKSSTKGGA